MVREYYVVIECTVRVEVHDRANAAGNDESLHTRRCGLANEVHRAFHGALSLMLSVSLCTTHFSISERTSISLAGSALPNNGDAMCIIAPTPRKRTFVRRPHDITLE